VVKDQTCNKQAEILITRVMTKNKQIQKAVVAQQAGRDINNLQGASVDEIVTLLDNFKESLRSEFNLANTRTTSQVDKLTRIIVPKLTDDELRSAFADPAFQMNIGDAYRSAISTDSDDDIQILSNILEARARIKSPTPRHKMATKKALEVVGQISNNDLDTLTLLWFGLRMIPQGMTLDACLSMLETYLQPFVESGIQENRGWIADLDILDCFQVSNTGINHLKSFAELIADNKYPGFFCTGMDEEEAKTARVKLKSIKAGLEQLVVEHPFNSNRFVLMQFNEEKIREIVSNNVKTMTPRRISLLDEVVALNKYGQKIDNFVHESSERIKNYPSLKLISEWWREDFPAMDITSVGIVLAYSNFKHAGATANIPPLVDLLSG
jgi:hypothetical protein